MKLLIINGPNINMLGIREPEIYGSQTYDNLCQLITAHCKTYNVESELFQSNHEGDIVDKIQWAYKKIDGIVINPAAYTHTSVAILDALKAVQIPTVEVHISEPDERESFRHQSFIRPYCLKTISGKGFDGYIEAIDFLIKEIKHES